MDRLNICLNIKRLREEKKLSVIQMSEILKVERNTYYSWENGKVAHTIENLLKIAEVLDTSVVSLITDNVQDNTKKVELVDKNPLESSAAAHWQDKYLLIEKELEFIKDQFNKMQEMNEKLLVKY